MCTKINLLAILSVYQHTDCLRIQYHFLIKIHNTEDSKVGYNNYYYTVTYIYPRTLVQYFSKLSAASLALPWTWAIIKVLNLCCDITIIDHMENVTSSCYKLMLSLILYNVCLNKFIVTQ